MNRILPIILLAASVWVVLGFIRPQFAETEVTKGLIEERKQTLNDAERVIEKRDSIMAEYASISDEEVTRLKMLLPDRVDGVRGVLELSVLANAYGLRMESVEVSSQSVPVRGVAGPAPDPASLGPDGLPLQSYTPIPLRVSFKGTYEAFLAFLTDLEHSLRLADLSGLTIDARANDEDENDYTYGLSLTFYQYSL